MLEQPKKRGRPRKKQPEPVIEKPRRRKMVIVDGNGDVQVVYK